MEEGQNPQPKVVTPMATTAHDVPPSAPTRLGLGLLTAGIALLALRALLITLALRQVTRQGR